MAQPNLMVSLYKWAFRQQENYTTDAFAHVVAMLRDRCPQVARDLMAWLADLPEGALPAPDKEGWDLRTQEYLKDQGILDLRLQAGGCDIIVEVKLDGGVSFGQLDAYRGVLEHEKAYVHRKLVSLTGRNPCSVVPEGTVVRLWHEVEVWLQERLEKRTIDPDKHPICAHLVREFIGLLHHLHIAAIPIRSPISEGVKEHRDNFDKSAGKSPFEHRLYSLHDLDPFTELHPLRDLFAMVSQILHGIPEIQTVRVQSSEGRWFGVVMNYLEFHCYVWLADPDVLWFEYWNREFGVDPTSFDKKSGELYESYRAHRWKVKLDLASGFYESDPADQRRILEEFLRDSLEYSKSLRPGPAKGPSPSGPTQDEGELTWEDLEPPPL